MGFGFWPDGHWAVGFWPDGFWVDQDKIQLMGSAKPVGEIARYIERKRLPRTIRVAEFNGVDSKIDAGADCIGIGPVTVCCWVRALTNGGGDGSMLFWNGAIFAYFVGNSIVFTSLWNTEVTTPYTYWKQWKHLAITRNELGNASIYLDGVLVGDPDRFSGVPSSATTQLIIGNWASGNRPVYGNMADFAIFNRLLNPYEIKQVMTTGIPQTGVEGDLLLDLRLSKNDMALGPELVSNGDFSQWTGEADPNNTPVGWTKYEPTLGYAQNATNACKLIRVTGTTIFGVSQPKVTKGKAYQIGANLVAGAPLYINMAGAILKTLSTPGTGNVVGRASGGTAYWFTDTATDLTFDDATLREYWLTDLSTNQRRAYPQNAPSWVELPSGLSVMDFNGTTDLLQVGTEDWIGTGDVTFEAWIRPEGWGGGDAGDILCNGRYIMYTNGYAKNITLYSAGGGSFANTGVITLSTWYHIAATRTATGVTNFYVNGVLSGTPNQTSGTPVAGTTPVYIGNNSPGDRAFDGQISGVRVYQGIKSPEFIYNRYQSTRGYYLDSGYTIPPASRSGLALHYALTSQDAPSGIYDNWAHWLPIRIDHTKIDEDLTDFPVLVSLDESNFDFTKARSNGYDIRFIGPDGVSLLSYERVSHDAVAKTAEYWVKVPKVKADSDTPIALLYGNPGAGDGADGMGVWSNGYAAVYHMGDETSSRVLDSTVNGNHGTKKGDNAPSEVNGKIGKAQDSLGYGYINCGNDASLNPAHITVSMWVKMTIREVWTKNYLLSNTRDCCGEYYGYDFRIERRKVRILLWNYPKAQTAESPTTIYDDTWYHVGFRYDGSKSCVTINGEIDASLNNIYGIGSPASFNTYIGAMGWNPDTCNAQGIFDEIRISNVARSSAWIKADYHSTNNTLLTIGGAHD